MYRCVSDYNTVVQLSLGQVTVVNTSSSSNLLVGIVVAPLAPAFALPRLPYHLNVFVPYVICYCLFSAKGM